MWDAAADSATFISERPPALATAPNAKNKGLDNALSSYNVFSLEQHRVPKKLKLTLRQRKGFSC